VGGHSIAYSKQKFVYVHVCPIRTVSEIELFQCTVLKFLMEKIYYVVFLIPVFIVQVTKLVQFTEYNTFFKNSTVNINAYCNSYVDMACCSSVECAVYFTVK
jgi:hypothetical protein